MYSEALNANLQSALGFPDAANLSFLGQAMAGENGTDRQISPLSHHGRDQDEKLIDRHLNDR